MDESLTGAKAVVARGSVALPALSHVARPSNRVKAMPPILEPSNATCSAGTTRRIHWPAGGKGPIYRLLAVFIVPYSIRLAPQYALCSHEPSCHCSISSLGTSLGSK